MSPETVTDLIPAVPNTAFAPGIQFVANPKPSSQFALAESQLAPFVPFQTSPGVMSPVNTSSKNPDHDASPPFAVIVKRYFR